MKLDPHDTQKEKDRVFAMMKEYPSTYVSGSDGKGVCMIQGSPFTVPIDFAKALEHCKQFGGVTHIAWNGTKGKWYAIWYSAHASGSNLEQWPVIKPGKPSNNMSDKPFKGQQVQSGSKVGTVLKMQGPHAVQVWTTYQTSDQDFVTGKISQISGSRKETWPIKCIQPINA